jgi:deoxyxylulose-5-phosphate synthase
MVLPDRFIDQASPAEMYSDAGMSEGHVIDRCTNLLHKGLSIPENHTDNVNIQSS